MNPLTTSLAGLSAAAAIVLGGLHFAPTPTVPLGTRPTTNVTVQLRQSEPGVIADGEVTTTIYRVIDPLEATAKVGGSVATSTKATWTAALPDGEYLIKTVPTPNSTLSSVDDIDGPSPVPTGSGCTNRLDCSWIKVAGNTWTFHGKTSPNPEAAEFSLSRLTASSFLPATPVAATSTKVTAGTATATPTAPTTQTMMVAVLDWSDGKTWSKPVAGTAVIVQFIDPNTQIPFLVADRTDANGTATLTIPLRQYSVIVQPPAGYEILDSSHLGTFAATSKPSETAGHIVGLRKIPTTTTTSTPATAPETPAPAHQTAGGQPVDTTPADTTPADTTPADTTPADTTPADTTPASAPTDTTTPTTTPVPVTVPTVTAPTVTEPAATAPARTLGCDESDDPEIQALLHLNDGAIRWIEDGELLTLYPEPGMDPVVVCDAAYHRIVDMGIDADYVSGGG